MHRSLLTICTVALFAFTLPFVGNAYTSPGTPQGFVNDFASVLTPEEEQLLERKLRQFESESSNEIAVVTIPTTKEETIEEYAVQLFEEWGIGKAENDNGILLLVARDDREMRIEVGYGLEGAITDLQSSTIIRDILAPSFREGNFYTGISEATDALMAASKGEYVPQNGPKPSSGFNANIAEIVIFGVFFIIPWIGSVLARSKSWWGGGIVGGIAAAILGLVLGSTIFIIALIFLVPFGLIFDYIVSKTYKDKTAHGEHYPWWIGGGGPGSRGGFGGGGFGGFGGGGSGGGGSSGSW